MPVHQRTPTRPGQQPGGGSARTPLTLATIADLVAVVSVPVSAFEWTSWTAVSIVAGSVAVVTSLMHLNTPSTRGSTTRPFAAVLLVAGMATAAWGLVGVLNPGGGGGGPTPTTTTTTGAIGTTTPSTIIEPPGSQEPPVVPDTPTGNATTSTGQDVEFAGPLFSQGFSLTTNSSYDLDSRDTAFPSEGADLGLDSSSLYTPASGGLLLSARTDGDPHGCAVEAPYTNRLPVEDIPDGRPICVVTDQGRLAVVVVTGIGASEVAMGYELWEIR